ncbi:hypothetical protein HMPREF2812_06780 [Propionibacterium sp. HMSC069G10]|nr:hypothetical protein HMPREF2812_06780 [Propionibacterium sp. HMSC069G10]PIS93101.1 hypothetical protein CER06_10705 [Cutibacterium acnes]
MSVEAPTMTLDSPGPALSLFGGRGMEPIALAMPDRSCSSDPCPYLTDDRRSTDAVGMGGVRIIPPWEPRDRR